MRTTGSEGVTIHDYFLSIFVNTYIRNNFIFLLPNSDAVQETLFGVQKKIENVLNRICKQLANTIL